MIQIPRLYKVYRAKGLINNFGEMISNIFKPLFEVTIDPSSHPELHLFLTIVSAFDSVDDESIREHAKYQKYPEPHNWNEMNNPPYIVWSYYLYANIYLLNKLRELRNMNTFQYRPHAGEAGDIDHVCAAFLLANSINHGITLKKSPTLQYLYYLKQVGISMSPLSNNLLFLEYDKNPFSSYFQRGLKVTLSTDDPLMIHYSKDPLIEEYAVAAQVYKLSNVDMCEIARNSVIISGFPHKAKQHWIGKYYLKRGPKGNDIKQTNVPNIRLKFRDECLMEEENWLLGLHFDLFPTVNLRRNTSKPKLKQQTSVNLLNATIHPLLNEENTTNDDDNNNNNDNNIKGTKIKFADHLHDNYFKSLGEQSEFDYTHYYLQNIDNVSIDGQNTKTIYKDNTFISKKDLLMFGVGFMIGIMFLSNYSSKKKDKK